MMFTRSTSCIEKRFQRLYRNTDFVIATDMLQDSVRLSGINKSCIQTYVRRSYSGRCSSPRGSSSSSHSLSAFRLTLDTLSQLQAADELLLAQAFSLFTFEHRSCSFLYSPGATRPDVPSEYFCSFLGSSCARLGRKTFVEPMYGNAEDRRGNCSRGVGRVLEPYSVPSLEE